MPETRPPAAREARRPLPKVPLGHAVFMAAQSMRNRFGRNLITLAGIALGIAFLMSVLTGDTIRRGLQGYRDREEAVRAWVARVATVAGTVTGRKFALLGDLEPDSVAAEAVQTLLRSGAQIAWCWPAQPDRLADRRQAVIRGLSQAEAQRLSTHASLEPALAGSLLAVVPSDWRNTGIAAADLARLSARLEQPAILDFSEQVNPSEQAALKDQGWRVEGPARPDPELLRKRSQDQREADARTLWLVAVSILVSFIGIANSMLMSVYERFREIGTMKCLGASNGFVVLIFLLEAAFQGLVGAVIGTLVGFVFSVLAGLWSDGWRAVANLETLDVLEKALLAIVFGSVLGVAAAIGPARRAARMVPADALRTEI